MLSALYKRDARAIMVLPHCGSTDRQRHTSKERSNEAEAVPVQGWECARPGCVCNDLPSFRDGSRQWTAPSAFCAGHAASGPDAGRRAATVLARHHDEDLFSRQLFGRRGVHREPRNEEVADFDLQIQNLGDADAILGTPAQRPDLYVFSPCHGHYHIRDSLDYSMSYGGSDTPAFYDTATGFFFIGNKLAGGEADVVFGFGAGGVGYIPIMGDWDGDGDHTIGLYHPATSTFFLKNTNTPGPADVAFGSAAGLGCMPVVGDWNGDGIDTIGVYNPATGAFFLKNTNAPGGADVLFIYGPPGAVPLAGDWNGDGVDTIGVYNPATGAFFLRNSNSSGPADAQFIYGSGGGLVGISGDWNADGVDTIGVYNPASGVYFLRNDNSPGVADIAYQFGVGGPNAIPVAGDWDYDLGGSRCRASSD